MRHSLDRSEIQRIIAINREDMDREAECYREKRYRPWHVRYLWGELDQALEPLRGIESARILSLGCGVGVLTQMVMKKLDGVVAAVDVSGKSLEFFMQSMPENMRSRVRTHAIDAESFLSNTTEAFHLILFSAVLHHIPNYLDVLEMACDITAPGGVIFIAKEPAPKAEQGRLGRWLSFLDGNIHVQEWLCKTSIGDWCRYNRRYLRKVLPKSSRWYRRIDEDVRKRDILHSEAEYYSEIDRQAVLRILRDAGFDILVSDAGRPTYNYRVFQSLADIMAKKVNTLITFKVIAQRRIN